MKTFPTHELTPESKFTAGESLQTYCGLDCCVTLEVLHEIKRSYNVPPTIYDFERALQGPYLEMMQRGFLTDDIARKHATRMLDERILKLTLLVNKLSEAASGKGLNPNSSDQIAKLLYGSMRVPEVWISKKGKRSVSTNREALEKVSEQYLLARPLCEAILRIHDLKKQREVMVTEIDADGRFRSSYNIAGTETGRPSSSKNAFGTGRNAQNIDPQLRYVFVADPGWKLCTIDLEQVEARDVGYLCGVLFDDWTFLDATESGDFHTTNTKLIWPNDLPWTGDPVRDKALASGTNFYREFSYRDMAKRGGHLSNYMGTAYTASRVLKVPFEIMNDFQIRYCRGTDGQGTGSAYPTIPRYWRWCAERLQTVHAITTPFGRTRHFFGRPGDDTTLREAIANTPQSMTGDRMNLGLWRIWYYMPEVRIVAQGFDSVTFMYRDNGADAEAETISKALELVRVELIAPNGRRYVVPGEAKIGWNWGSRSVGKDGKVTNDEGLVKWTQASPDKRVRRTGLQRRGF